MDLGVDLSPSQVQGTKLIVVDSTGLKVYGEGEWKVRQHGHTKRRTWRKFYEACVHREVEQIAVPPQRNAKIWQHGNSSKPSWPRDQILRRIRRVGRKRWKEEVGYHRRSLAETAMFRFKIIFGNTLSTRTLARQVIEARIKCAALNRMTQRGMPKSYRVV